MTYCKMHPLTHIWTGKISDRSDLPLAGQSEHHVMNSEALIQKCRHLNLQEMDMLVSFNMVSLFIKVPVERHFAVALTACIRYVLTTTYFLYNSSFYDQRGSIAIGSPLAPVRANFYIQSFKQEAIS
jgi:hypothetical protein